MAALILKVNALHKSEMEYNGKFVHNLGRIQNVSLMRITDICFISCRIATQNVAPILPDFQGIKCCIQCIYSHPHNPIFYPSSSYDGSNFIRPTWIGNKVGD